MATKITFVNDSGKSVEELLNSYRFYTPGHDNRWGELQGVSDKQEADYLVVLTGFPKYRSEKGSLNLLSSVVRFILPVRLRKLLHRFRPAPPAIKHPAKIYLQMEPPEIKQPDLNPSDFIFFGSYAHHHHVSAWHVKKPFQELKSLAPPHSFKPLSAVVSGKNWTEAQKQRIETLLQVSRLYEEIDVYGQGLDPEKFGQVYKGPLNYNGDCKFKGLYGYRYSLAFENSRHENYFSEKLTDCFLCWSKPIYWGCPNILDYFPEESLACVDIFDSQAPEKIIEELSKPVNYDAIREARELVMKKYNIWPALENIIHKYEEAGSDL